MAQFLQCLCYSHAQSIDSGMMNDQIKRLFLARADSFFFCCCFFSWWWYKGSKCRFKLAIIRPPAKRHLNGVSLACRWWPNIECYLGSLVPFQGIRTSIAMKPYIFVIFQGVLIPFHPLWIHPCLGPTRYPRKHVYKISVNEIFPKNVLQKCILHFEECNSHRCVYLHCISEFGHHFWHYLDILLPM